MDGTGRITHFLAVKEDISDRKRLHEEQELALQRMQSLLELNHQCHRPMEEINAAVVEAAIRVTRSEIGYLALLSDNESVLTMQYWSKSAYAACAIEDKSIVYPVQRHRPLGRGRAAAQADHHQRLFRRPIRTSEACPQATCPSYGT